MELNYEQRSLLRRIDLKLELLFFYLLGPTVKRGAPAPPPDVAFEADRLDAIQAERAARTILPGSPIKQAFVKKDGDLAVFETETSFQDNPYELRVLHHRIGEADEARWVELADFRAGRPLVEATADVEASARWDALEAWEDANWLGHNPQARAAEPMPELHPVEIDILVPCGTHDEDVWDNGRSYRWITVEVFTETGCSPWDATQWEIDHAPSDFDGLDARCAALASECVTLEERRTKVAVQGCYARLRAARLEARKALNETLVKTVAAQNRALLVELLLENGYDPKHPATIAWVESFKRKARGRDGLAYARAIDDLKRRHIPVALAISPGDPSIPAVAAAYGIAS
jgi:hypothetical protein